MGARSALVLMVGCVLTSGVWESGARVSLGLAEIGLPVQGGDAIVLEMLAGKARIFNCCR